MFKPVQQLDGVNILKQTFCLFGFHRPSNIEFHQVKGVGDEEYFSAQCSICGKHSTSDSDNNFKHWYK